MRSDRERINRERINTEIMLTGVNDCESTTTSRCDNKIILSSECHRYSVDIIHIRWRMLTLRNGYSLPLFLLLFLLVSSRLLLSWTTSELRSSWVMKPSQITSKTNKRENLPTSPGWKLTPPGWRQPHLLFLYIFLYKKLYRFIFLCVHERIL